MAEASSIDLNEPYALTLPDLGHAAVINNQATELPETVPGVETLESTLETIGFKVKSYKDLNAQGMRQIEQWIMRGPSHQNSNTFLLAIICHAMEQGWLLDMNKKRAYTLKQLGHGLSGVENLNRKPKVIVIQEYDTGGASGQTIIEHENEDMFIACATYRRVFGEGFFTALNEVAARSIQSDKIQDSFLRTLALGLRENYRKLPFVQIVQTVKQSMTTGSQMEPLTDADLAQLAPKISFRSMQSIAIQRLGFTEAEVESLVDGCREDTEKFRRQILVQWRNKNTGSRRKLAGLLKEAAIQHGNVDFDTVTEILKIQTEEELDITLVDNLTKRLDFSLFGGTHTVASRWFDPLNCHKIVFITLAVFVVVLSITQPYLRPPLSSQGEEIGLVQTQGLTGILEQPQTSGNLELEFIGSTDMGVWWSISGLVAMTSSNKVVTVGRRTRSWSLYVFHRDGAEVVNEEARDVPCNHTGGLWSLFTVVKQGRELLGVSCSICKDIRLVDIETGQVTPVFQFETHAPCSIYSRPNGGAFAHIPLGEVLEFNDVFTVTNRFYSDRPLSTGLCHLPIPKNYLILTNPPNPEITAISALNGHNVWPRRRDVPGQQREVLYVPQRDALLVSDAQNPRLLVVNATDGSLLPTIDLPGGYRVHTMCWCNGLLVTLQWTPRTKRYTLAYYKLK